MTVTLPPAGELGVEIDGANLAALDRADVEHISTLVHEHKLVVIRNQQPEEPEYIAFAGKLGVPQPYFQNHYHHPDYPEIFVSSNVQRDGRKFGVAGTGRFWHSDYSFFAEPVSMTMIRPVVLPGGDRGTAFIDMERAYRELPEHLRRRLDGTRAFHDAVSYYKVQPWDVDKAIAELIVEFHAIAPGVWHPTVITHPVTERKLLFVSRGFTTAVEGLGDDENESLLAELFDFVERQERIHFHRWREGDVVLWDNRSVIHRACPGTSGEPSCSFRISLFDGLPFYRESGETPGAQR